MLAILFHVSSFLLTYWLIILIPAVTVHIFNTSVELAIPIKEAKGEIEIRPVTTEDKISAQSNLKRYNYFCTSYS